MKSADEHIFSAQEVTRKVCLLHIPLPEYTEEARESRTWGTVVLGVVCSSIGRVDSVEVVVGLPNGLTERAVQAAQGIVFEPALKDGRAVSQYIEIWYDFKYWRERATLDL